MKPRTTFAVALIEGLRKEGLLLKDEYPWLPPHLPLRHRGWWTRHVEGHKTMTAIAAEDGVSCGAVQAAIADMLPTIEAFTRCATAADLIVKAHFFRYHHGQSRTTDRWIFVRYLRAFWRAPPPL